MELSGSGVDGDSHAVQQMKDYFECPQCLESMLDGRECVLTACDHTFCVLCLAGWQKTCILGGRMFTCPVCTREVKDPVPFRWPPRLLNNLFDVAKNGDVRLQQQQARVAQLEDEKAREAGQWQRERQQFQEQLRDIERERNALHNEQQAIVEQMSQRQQELQGVLEEFRASQVRTLSTKDAEMQRLRDEITAMERKRVSDRELHGARERMRTLEAERAEREEREAQMQERMRELELAVEANRAELRAKEVQLEHLQHRKDDLQDAVGASAVPVDAGSPPQSPLYQSFSSGSKWVQRVWSSPAVSGSVTQGGLALKYVTRLVRDTLLAHGKPAALLRREDEYELRERRGNHYGSPVWRAIMARRAAPAAAGAVDEASEPVAVAVKMRSKNADAYREAMLLYSLSHPHIVPLLGVFEASGSRLGLLMPFVDMDLEWWLASENRSIGERDRLCFQLVAAVAYAHGHDVVHRGISPAAVLVSGPSDGSPSLHVRLASWTSAVSLASPRPLARAAERCSRYRSPELVLNEQDTISNWKAVDAWAVGAVLWETLNGAHCSPIVSEGSQDRAVLMRALLSWDEFRKAASRAQPVAPLVQAVLEEPRAAKLSLAHHLEANMVSEPMGSLLSQLLAWDAGARVSLADALLHPVFALYRPELPADAVRYLENPRLLADTELDAWVDHHIKADA